MNKGIKKIGFIGTGIMGSPMACNLARAGVSVDVYDINSDAAKEVIKCGATLSTLDIIGAECSIIFLILPRAEIVKKVIFDKNGLNPSQGQIICDMSSVTAEDSRFCSQKLANAGVRFVDAPVSGGEPKAIDGTLAFMVGGSKEDFEELKPYFEIMGSNAVLVGDSGCGSIAKLTNQILVNMTIATIGEAFVLAKKAGADPRKVYEAIKGGLAGSTVLDAKLPMILERNFEPGGKISINYKDIKNVMDTGRSFDLPMIFTTKLEGIMEWMEQQGYENYDHAALVKYFEEEAGEEIK